MRFNKLSANAFREITPFTVVKSKIGRGNNNKIE